MKAGWEARSIASFAKTGAGGTPKKSTKEFYEGGDIPWLLSGEVANANITEAKNFITIEGLKGSSAKRFPADSVLVAMYGATAGEVGVLRFEATTNQAVCAVLPSERHIPEYLYYYLLHAKPALVAQAVGNAQPNISQAKIKSLEIPLPPLEEQQRIVAVLDEAFEGLARARAHTEANLQNARELFEAQLGEFFENPPDDWKTQCLKEITTKVGSGATPKGGAKSYKTEGISLIRSLNVHDRRFKEKDLAFIDNQQAEKLGNVIVETGDVLLNITGASVARCCLTPHDKLPARVNQHVSIIRSEKEVLLPEFLTLMLTSRPYKGGLLKTGEDNGSTRQALTKAIILNLEVSFPPDITEQRIAVERLSEAERQTMGLAAGYEAKLQDLDDLRQSLLQKAFAGELT